MKVFGDIAFLHPWFLLLLGVLPLLYWWLQRKRHRRYIFMRLPGLDGGEMVWTWRKLLFYLLPILKILAAALMILALARPQKLLQEEEIKAEGIDIFMVMDLSSSMLAKDFKPDRLEASKRMAADFVSKRKYDRIGLAVFAAESFTQCPLTPDHKVLKEFLAGIQCGFLQDGTAIGMGLAAGVNRLKDSEAKSKIVILLTDGVNNAGYIKPITAAEIAREFGVKVYTIGVGSEGTALAPVSKKRNGQYHFGMTRVEIDEALLKQISQMTGGQYFRARNEANLEKIYEYIDQLEKTEMDVTVIKRYEEMYFWPLLIAAIILLLDRLLKQTILRIQPA